MSFFRPSLYLFLAALLTFGCSQNGIYHSVRQGETLYRIGKTYDVDPQYLGRVNGIFFPRNLKAGQRIFIPGATSPRRVIPYNEKRGAPKPSAVSKSTVKVSKPAVKKASRKKASTQKTTKNSTKKPVRKSVVGAQQLKFTWPVKGRVLRTFNPNGKVPCRGLEIAASAGTPVKSAGAGRVIYSGNGIRGYGNLIILEHENSFFTVYGYNRKNLVQTGTFVGDGEKIALTGRPPDGRSPRLHFEVRQGNAALDPRLFLP